MTQTELDAKPAKEAKEGGKSMKQIKAQLDDLKKKYKYLLLSSATLLSILLIAGILLFANYALCTGVGP
jgi:hypothetical protein